MKKFIVLLCAFSLIFNMSVVAFASDDDDDDNDDFNTYEWLASQGYLPVSDENYAEVYNDVIRTHVGESRHHVYQDLYDKYVSGLITFRDYVKDVHLELKNDGVNVNEFYDSLLANIQSYENYFTIPTFPASRFGRMYQENLNGLNYIQNVINNQKLSLVWSNSDWGYDNYLGGVSRDLSEAVFINVNNTNPDDIVRAYNGYYNFSRHSSGGTYVAHICDSNGDNISVSLLPNAPSQSTVSYEYGSYCKMLIYNDSAYSVVPVFRDKASYMNYLSGNISFYTLDYLKSLKLEELKSIDYKKLQTSINNAISNGTWLTANELQAIINGSLLNYLEEMGLDIKSILLAMQSGLFDENGLPYLKDINDKMTIIINNLGSGGSYNDLELQLKLDLIIALLGLPDFDIDIDNPELDDLKNLSLIKFPFSIPTDIMLIISVIGVEPEKPELEIGFPLMGSDEVYTTTIDLDWFDAIQPYWFTFCDIGYCIFLLMLSLKIIEGVKE